MSTTTNPQRIHLSVNAADTAVLLSERKTLPPNWAVITRGSASRFIDSHHARHTHFKPLTWAEARFLVPLASVAIVATIYLVLTGATVIWGLPLIVLGALFAITRLPKPLPPELERQVDAITHQDDALASCPVPIALELTEAEHSALRVAADYDVVDEVLNALVERHDARLEAAKSHQRALLEAEQARRRELAEEIMNDHATEGSRRAESTGS